MRNSAILCQLVFFLVIITVSCSQNPGESSPVRQNDDSGEVYSEIKEFRPIFYDMYSPVEARRLFYHLDMVFDISILNPVYNIQRYNSSGKIAVNLGIYGANMSFCHMFGQTQEAINYLSAISRLAHSIGISDRFISNAAMAHERMVYHPDSLFDLATNIYLSADRQLIELDRAGAASLILAGGWIEALYIVGSFYDAEKPDIVLEEQILSQKYSLDRLITLLSNHQNDELISKYLLLVKQLKHVYDRVEILFEPDDLTIDHSDRTLIAQRPVFNYTQNDLDEIVRLVALIRSDMVN
ncbi:MAG: hypothetical protein ACFCUM_04305 [Bacteroidales bacterium]